MNLNREETGWEFFSRPGFKCFIIIKKRQAPEQK
jgi:hypothetical protein